MKVSKLHALPPTAASNELGQIVYQATKPQYQLHQVIIQSPEGIQINLIYKWFEFEMFYEKFQHMDLWIREVS